MNNELKRMWKEAVVARLKVPVPSRHLPERKPGIDEKRQSGQTVCGPRFESENSRIRSSGADYSARRSVLFLCKVDTYGYG
jgi:hypothetical protein